MKNIFLRSIFLPNLHPFVSFSEDEIRWPKRTKKGERRKCRKVAITVLGILQVPHQYLKNHIEVWRFYGRKIEGRKIDQEHFSAFNLSAQFFRILSLLSAIVVVVD